MANKTVKKSAKVKAGVSCISDPARGIRGTVVVRSLGTVRPNGWNPNTMTPELEASLDHGMRTDGWLASQALLVWGHDEAGDERNVIIDGEHRWASACRIGLAEGPMVFLDGITEAQAKALTVKMNQKRGTWDDAKLGDVLRSIAQAGERVDDVEFGFQDDALAQLMAMAPPAAPDGGDVSGGDGTAPADEDVPVVPTDALEVKWKPAPGQVWVVPSLTSPGRDHRLTCGDCRDPEVVARLHGGVAPALGLHDPPYGISAMGLAMGRVGHGPNKRHAGGAVSSRQRGDKAHKTMFAPIVGDDEPFDPQHLLDRSARCCLWGANHYADRLPPSAEYLIWVKIGDEAAESDFSSAELAWVTPPMDRKGHVRRVVAPSQGGFMEGEKRLHPTQKPVAVQVRAVELYSQPGDVVTDHYMGAGAVGLACEKLGRVFHGCDIAPAYLAATLERFERLGLKPRLVE